MAQRRPQFIIFTYHKAGTSLFANLTEKLAASLGLRVAVHYGQVWHVDPHADIVRLPHGLLGLRLDRRFRAIRVIRDPRDIWVSGYLYHRHCREFWCVNTDFDPTAPIGPPQVDFSFQHRPERWKRRYLQRLHGRSYQQNLLDRSLSDGLAFELENFTSATLDAMRAWWLDDPAVLTVRLEDIVHDFDGMMLTIFRHWGATETECAAALDVARTEDIGRMSDAAIGERPQIHGRTLSKWRTILSQSQVAQFERLHGDLITALGYTLCNETMPRPVRSG